MKANRHLGIGVIGLGIGRWHVEEFSRLPGVRVAAACDRDPERLRETCAKFDIPRATASPEELVAGDDVDAVVVALPNHLHEPAACAAIEAGKHLLCEKPLAHTLDSARRIARAAAARPELTACMGMKFRFMGAAHALIRAVEDGTVGVPYHGFNRYVRPVLSGMPSGWFRRKAQSGGGALIDNGVHLLDLNWYLMGRPRPVRAFGVCQARIGRADDAAFDVDDFAAGLITFENGASIVVENGWAAHVPETLFEVRVLGDRGGFEYCSGRLWTTGADGGFEERPAAETPASGPTQFEHFAACIRGRTENRSPLSDGLTLMSMIEALYASHRSGTAEPVEV